MRVLVFTLLFVLGLLAYSQEILIRGLGKRESSGESPFFKM
jgi:hypothetical protein